MTIVNVCIVFNSKYCKPEASVSQIMSRDTQRAAKHLRIYWQNYEGKGRFNPLPFQPSHSKNLVLKCTCLNVLLN